MKRYQQFEIEEAVRIARYATAFPILGIYSQLSPEEEEIRWAVEVLTASGMSWAIANTPGSDFLSK